MFSIQSPFSSFNVVTTVEVGWGGVYRRRISIYDTRKNPEEGGLKSNREEEEVNEGDDDMGRYG